MKYAIITAICGMNMPLVNPKQVFEGVDYIAFVDNIRPNLIWQQHTIPKFSSDGVFANRRNAKIFKIIPHLMVPGYDYYFWVDGTHEVVQHPKTIIENYLGDAEIGLFTHKYRHCAYDEANEIIRLNYDHRDLVENQLKFYKTCGYPKQNGLYELPVSIRKNTNAIQTMNLRWWEMICRFSSRDQVSLPFVLWSLQITPKILPGCANCGLYQNELIPQTRFKF